MASNGSWQKMFDIRLAAAVILIATVSGYAVMRYQVGNHEDRIKTVEKDQSDIKERLSGIETLQGAQVTAMENMLKEMRRIHTVPAGGGS